MRAPAMSPGDDFLIPIRVNVNVDGERITEHMLWNPNETATTPSDVATILCADLGVPTSTIPELTTSIIEQIDSALLACPQRPADSRPRDARQLIQLNVRLGRVLLRDQFEWDLSDSRNCPETFAAVLCADLGLGREFVPVVAGSVREQLQSAAGPRGKQRRRGIIPVLDSRSVVRAPGVAEAWEPIVECLNVTQQRNLELKERREARTARRMSLGRSPGAVAKLGSRPYRRT